MSYKRLEIWRESREVSVLIHKMTMALPKFEQFEVGQQIRRSSKSVGACIVEGYGRRFYKAEFIKYLIYASASAMETIEHLEMLKETHSLHDEVSYQHIHQRLTLLSKKLLRFMEAVQNHHISKK